MEMAPFAGAIFVAADQFVILYPVAFTIGCQNAVSAARALVRSSGVEPTGISVTAFSFSLISGRLRISAAAVLSFFAKSSGEPAGSHMPYQPSATRSTPDSFRVGTSDRNGERVGRSPRRCGSRRRDAA